MRRYGSGPNDFLFHEGEWHPSQEMWKRQLQESIESKNGDELLNTSTVDLAKYYASEYKFDVPEIYPDEVVVSERETQVDISQDQMRMVRDRSRPTYIPGTAIDIELPFSGPEIGFKIQATTRNFNNPRATIGSGILKHSIAGVNLEADAVRKEIEKWMTSIEQHLEWLRNDSKSYNDSLEAYATGLIEKRKEKLLKDKSLVSGLGFKMKPKPGMAGTFAAQKVKRKIRPSVPKPKASREPYQPEPVLTEDDYEHVLTVLENMSGVMESNPGAFRQIDEESLRMHFLMQLNGHFPGEATAETFNYEGKTDILIKVDGRNIFIGECKFWAGDQAFQETLDQVLSYLSWRDTKASVLIFSRNKDFTGVLGKIKESTPNHPNCKGLIKQRSETSWTYRFGHKDDSNREIIATVQAFNVPERIQPRIRSVG